MKKIIAALFALGFCNASLAVGVGFSKILDVTLRANDDLLLVRMEDPDSDSSQPVCVDWNHTYGLAYSGDTAKAIYSLLLAAQTSGQTAKVVGTGSCITGTGTEEIEQVNIGPWH